MSDPTQGRPATGAADQLRLAMHLCFKVQNASRAFGAVYRNVLRETGLTYPQYLVMVALWEHDELSVKRLGELLRLDSGTLSPLLKRLEAAGLVIRERSTSDERSVTVRLTEAGLELHGPAEEVPRKIQAAANMQETDLHTLSDLLQRLTDQLDAAADRDDL
jgi:DNA-binding MarR family transcriptional regulator